MSHSFTPPIDPPGYTRDTVVEVSSTGDIDPLAATLQRNTDKLGAVVDKAADGYRSYAFDRAQEDKFIDNVEVLDAVSDSLLGATDALPETSLPYNSEKVEPAAETILAHRQTFTETCPTAAAVVPWDKVATATQRLKKVKRRKASLARRLENVEILEAHTLTFLADTLTTAHEQSASILDSNRGLSATFKPLTTLVRGAAEQAQETKRVVARALKRQGQKATAIVPVKDPAADDATKDPAAPDATKPKP